jgi:hypothetical protein
LAIGLKGSDVVTLAVAVQIGDPRDVVREVIAPGPPQAVTLKLHDELLAGFAEVAVSGVPLGGVEFPDQPPDSAASCPDR